MGPAPIYRKLFPSDLPAYRDFRLHAFRNSPGAFSESLEDEEEESPAFFLGCMGGTAEHFSFGCFLEGRLVGIATFQRDGRSKARHKSMVRTMYVDPAVRGRGIGKGLLQKILEAARALQGLEQVHLWVLQPEQSLARRLYLRSGFQPQGPVVKKDLFVEGGYVDAEYLVLSL
jgi:GNAT superfamily N-acetyltransferase